MRPFAGGIAEEYPWIWVDKIQLNSDEDKKYAASTSGLKSSHHSCGFGFNLSGCRRPQPEEGDWHLIPP
jgi:hypothetical protein